jgi:hypothetical protein
MLLRDDKGNLHVVETYRRVCQVSGYFKGTRWQWRPSMTPVPVPANVVETDTVPDWATDCPVGI